MATTKGGSMFIPQLTMFLLFVGFTMHLTVTQLMILNKTCLANGYGKDVCEHLNHYSEAEDDVQGKSATWNLMVPMLAIIPAAFLTLVLGPLSDTYGRKKILLIPIVAFAISAFAMLIQSRQHAISTLLLYGASVLIGLGGGLGTFMSTMISHVMDSTPPERRTEYLGLVFSFVPLGETIGTLCVGILWEQVGASLIYFLIFLSNIIIIISILLMKEVATTSDDKKRGNTFSVTGLLSNATAGLKVIMMPRQNGRRRKLILLLFAGPAAIFYKAADVSVVSLYTRRAPFQWTPSTYSYFAASKTVATVLGTALLAPIYIKVTGSRSDHGDLTMMCISFSTTTIQCLVMTIASESSHLLIVPFLFAFIGAVSPTTRSLSSKLVQPSEIGALNGFISFLNNFSAAIGGALFVSLYTKTVHTFPSVAFLTMMVFLIVCILVVLFLKADYRAMPELEDKKHK